MLWGTNKPRETALTGNHLKSIIYITVRPLIHKPATTRSSHCWRETALVGITVDPGHVLTKFASDARVVPGCLMRADGDPYLL